MKVLLTAINAKYIHSNLAIYSLRACAGPYKENIELAEFTINNQKDYILEEIYKKKPDIVCFSVYIWNLDYVESVAREFHKLCPNVPIWLGGPEVSYELETFLMGHPEITGLMVGEGEDTFREVCAYYKARLDGETQINKNPSLIDNYSSVEDYDLLSHIPGLAYGMDTGASAGREVVITQPRQVMDMSKIPFCYDTMEDFSNRIIYYESSRGCPFSCSYCLSSVDKRLRFRDVELVKKELQFFIDQRVPQIKFVDRTFNCNHAHAMEIWKYVIAHDNGVTNFHFEISADLINEEELALINSMRPGLIQLEIGVQSTNEVTIQEIHRTMRLDLLKKVVARIRRGGNVHQHLDLIAGLPYEGFDSFKNSFDEIYELKPNQLQLGFLKVLKGSYMFDHVEEYGIIYHDKPPYEVLRTNWLTFDEILRIKKVEEMLEVYYNSGQFEVTMKLMDVVFDSAFDMFLALGEFYESKGYMGMSHSRMKRCEILLEFVNDLCSENCEEIDVGMVEEALIFDLYYRENCKSRPFWAPAVSDFKAMTRVYCKNGKLSHIEPFHYVFPTKSTISLTELPERQNEAIWALFNYEKRDPLDNQAQVVFVKNN